MTNDYREMIYHLDNIIKKINSLSTDTSSDIKVDWKAIQKIKKTLSEFIIILKNQNNISGINLENLKNVSDMVYDLNDNNLFSDFTDYISNELYAFEFLLQQIKNK